MQTGNAKLQEALEYLIRALDEAGMPCSRLRLAKLLYLADWESYAGSNRVITGVRWRFWRYGPWAAEVQDALNAIRGLSVDEVEGETVEGKPYYGYKSTGGRLSIRHLAQAERVRLDAAVRHYGGLSRNDLLDHVYFETEPMQTASKGDWLDFAAARATYTELRERRKIPLAPMAAETVARLKAALRATHEQRPARVAEELQPRPRVDRMLTQALAAMEAEDSAAPVTGILVDAQQLAIDGSA